MTKLGFLISLVLLVLQLVGVVALTWLQVAGPLLIGLGLDLVIFVVGLAFLAITAAVRK